MVNKNSTGARGCGSRGRAPALRAQSPDFNPLNAKNTNKNVAQVVKNLATKQKALRPTLVLPKK
jgi:hypothetical protein